MKLLVLSKYSRKGASSRYRMFQYFPGFLEAKVQVETSALFDDVYLDRLYSKQSRLSSVFRSYLGRTMRLLKPVDSDLLWIEKELFPWVPWFIEKLFLTWVGKPYVVDYDDAIFHQYDQHRLWLVRKLLGNKCDHVMRHAKLVVGGNEYLCSRARTAGAVRVMKIPTVVSGKVFTPSTGFTNAEAPAETVPVIGWIGSMSTAIYLEALKPALQQLAKHHNFRFRVVGAKVHWPDFAVECVPWSEAAEVDLIKSFDIGVMPLMDSPWERGKCGFKLVQYMACGKPVVADPVGVNAEIVEEGFTGFLVSEKQSWFEALEKLLLEQELRTRLGQRGRLRFEAHYSLERWEAPLTQALFSVVARSRGSGEI